METGNSKPGYEHSRIEGGTSKGGDAGLPSEITFQISNPPTEHRSSVKYFSVGVAAIALMVALAIVVTRHRSSSATSQAEITPEQKNYLGNISVAGAKMSAATNFLGQRVIYLDAEVSNRGPRAVKQVEVSMEFTDVLGQVILREHAGVFPPALLPLKPGETREFQLFFDRIPSDWNQAPPRITPVSVQF